MSDTAKLHIHDDTDVTPEKVDAFAVATRTTQLEVLAILRGRVNDQSQHIEVAIFGVIMAVSLSGVILKIDLSRPWLEIVIIFLAYLIGGIILGVVLGLFARPHFRWVKRHSHAVVWLGAYESEIARRQTMAGRAGRKWRATH